MGQYHMHVTIEHGMPENTREISVHNLKLWAVVNPIH